MIVTENLTKCFGTTEVLKGVSMRVRKGKTRVILGLSGSGKSVLMKHMIGLLKPTSGRVLVEDEDLAEKNPRELLELRKKFGMVFQQAALFDSMNVFENVAFPVREHTDLSESEIEQRVKETLAVVDLEAAVAKLPRNCRAECANVLGLPAQLF